MSRGGTDARFSVRLIVRESCRGRQSHGKAGATNFRTRRASKPAPRPALKLSSSAQQDAGAELDFQGADAAFEFEDAAGTLLAFEEGGFSFGFEVVGERAGEAFRLVLATKGGDGDRHGGADDEDQE